MKSDFSPSRRAWNVIMTALVWAAAVLVIALTVGVIGLVLVRGRCTAAARFDCSGTVCQYTGRSDCWRIYAPFVCDDHRDLSVLPTACFE